MLGLQEEKRKKTSSLGSIQSFGQLSCVLWGKSVRLELCFSGWCLSELRVLSFLTLVGSITKQKNHFPSRAACVTSYPHGPPCILPHLLSYRSLQRSAPAPVLSLAAFWPPSCSAKVGNFFLQASGCPVHSGHFSVHKHIWSLPGTVFTYLALTKSKRRTQHPVHGTVVKQLYNFHQD